jgi:threonine/homoserine/homoserine lactone efflux protein
MDKSADKKRYANQRVCSTLRRIGPFGPKDENRRMPNMAELWLFLSATVVAFLVPGPDMVMLLETSASKSRAHALATAAGLAFSRAAHVTLAALGLAALLKTSPQLFEAIRLVGAVWLAWLGLQVFLSPAPEFHGGGARDGGGALRSYGAALRRGFVTNISNPSAPIFCSVLLPQFIRPELGGVAWQFSLLGALLVSVGFAFDMLYILVGVRVGRWAAQHPLADRLQRGFFGCLLIGFGFWMAFGARP